MAFALLLSFAAFTGCKKEEMIITVPPLQATFVGQSAGSYTILAANSSFAVRVGITTVATTDKTFTISVSSPTGAASPAQYTLSSSTVTIKAGSAIDSFLVRGNFAAYQAGRRDSLRFTIIEAGKEAGFNTTFTLAMRGPCFDGDVNLDEFLGVYARTNEDFGGTLYGPYTTTVTKVQQTSATTGTITVANIFDAGWTPLTFTLDWTNPNNRRATLVTQNAGGNAADVFGAGFAGQPFGVRAVSVAGGGLVGTFSICNQRIVLVMQVGIFGVGYAPDIYQVTLGR